MQIFLIMAVLRWCGVNRRQKHDPLTYEVGRLILFV